MKLIISHDGIPYDYQCICDGPVKEGNIEMLNYIYEELDFKNNEIMTKEIDPTIDTIWNDHPFYSFIVSGKIEIFKYLYKKGYPVDENLIIGTAMKGFHLEIIQYCLKKGMNFDRKVYIETYGNE